MVLTAELNKFKVKCFPSVVMNSDAACVPRITRYGISAFIGHILVPVLQSNRSIPLQNWSVLDCFILTRSRCSDCLLSNAMSHTEKFWVWP